MEMRVSSKGQIVIPQQIREKLRIKKGRKVAVEEVGGTIVIVPVPKDPVKAMKGMARGIFKESSVEIVRRLREEWK